MGPKKWNRPRGGIWYNRYRLEADGVMTEYREAVEAAIAELSDPTLMKRWQKAKKREVEDFNRTKPTFDTLRMDLVPTRSVKLTMLERSDNFEKEVQSRITSLRLRRAPNNTSSQSRRKTPQVAPSTEEAEDEDDESEKEVIRNQILSEMEDLQRQYDVDCARWQHETKMMEAEYGNWFKRREEHETLGRIVAAKMVELLSDELRKQLMQLPGAREDNSGETLLEGWLTVPEVVMEKIEKLLTNSAFTEDIDRDGMQIEFQSTVVNASQRGHETLEEYILRWQNILEKGRFAYGAEFDSVFPESIRARYLVNGSNLKEIKNKIENDALKSGVLEYPEDFNAAKRMLMSCYQRRGRVKNPTTGALYQVKVEGKENKQSYTRNDQRKMEDEKKKYQGKCYRCGETGHRKAECTKAPICYKCNKNGHLAYECNRNDKNPDGRRARVNMVEAAYIGVAVKDEGWTVVTRKNRKPNGEEKQPTEKKKYMSKLKRKSGNALENIIMLDSGAEVSIFCNAYPSK